MRGGREAVGQQHDGGGPVRGRAHKIALAQAAALRQREPPVVQLLRMAHFFLSFFTVSACIVVTAYPSRTSPGCAAAAIPWHSSSLAYLDIWPTMSESARDTHTLLRSTFFEVITAVPIVNIAGFQPGQGCPAESMECIEILGNLHPCMLVGWV